MAKDTSTSILFAKRPTTDIVPGETFNAVVGAAPTEADLQDGEVIFETQYLSLDPSMRVWLKGNQADLWCDLDGKSETLTLE